MARAVTAIPDAKFIDGSYRWNRTLGIPSVASTERSYQELGIYKVATHIAQDDQLTLHDVTNHLSTLVVTAQMLKYSGYLIGAINALLIDTIGQLVGTVVTL